MVNCSQRTFTYSHSVYDVGAAVEATSSKGSLRQCGSGGSDKGGVYKGPPPNAATTVYIFIAAFFETRLLPVHVPGVTNTVTDAISRNNMDAFHSQFLGATLIVIPPEVMDLLVRRCPDWTSQAWAWWFRNWLQQA